MKTPRYLVAVALGLVLLMSACGGSEEVSDFVPPPDESYPAELVEDGRALYERYCQSCHKSDGSGQVGPNIRQTWEKLSYDEEVDIVTNGRNQMPRFDQTLTAEEIDAVVAYTRVGW